MDSRATLPFTPRQLPQAVRDETLMRTLFECSIILAVVPGISDIPLHSSHERGGRIGRAPAGTMKSGVGLKLRSLGGCVETYGCGSEPGAPNQGTLISQVCQPGCPGFDHVLVLSYFPVLGGKTTKYCCSLFVDQSLSQRELNRGAVSKAKHV